MNDIEKNILVAAITAIPVSIVTTIVVNIKEYFKDTKIKRKYAAIVYYDMSRSLNQIYQGKKLNENYLTSKVENIFKNKFINLNKDNLFEYLVILRDRISEKDFHNIIVYYENICLLEDTRKKYWDSKEKNTIHLLGKEYIDNINMLELLYKKDEQGFNDTIENLRKIARIN